MNRRAAFAHWISGFSAGEATFGIAVARRLETENFKVGCRFAIGLREDDELILRRVKNYFGCGTLARIAGYGTGNPQVRYTVSALQDNLRCILPHFDRYPLRGKKGDDYLVFREAVLFMEAVGGRGRTGVGLKTSRWKDADIDHMLGLRKRLVDGRAYGPNPKPRGPAPKERL